MKRSVGWSLFALLAFAIISCGGGSISPATPAATNVTPIITGLVPSATTAGGGPLTIDVKGSGFVPTSTVEWNGATLATNFISSGELSAQLTAGNLVNGTIADVAVLNTGTSGGSSAAVQFIVNNPQPVLATVNPGNILVGGGALSLDITGSGFVPSSIVTWNNAPLSTTFVSGTEVKVALPAANDSSASIATVSVVNPAPAGGSSTAVRLEVDNPVPVISGTTPASIGAGSAATPLTIDGSGFVPSSVFLWNGTTLATTFVNNTRLSAAIPSQNIASGQVIQLSVANPEPGGGSSGIAFNVTSLTPHIGAISPATATQGLPATITLSGSGFEANSVVTWNGSSRPTTFFSPSSLLVTLTAVDTQTLGTSELAVSNPGPGGSTTAPVALAVVAVTAPVISSVSPASTLVNATGTTPLPITIQGSNFDSNATLTVNGQSLAIGGQTATTITTSIPSNYFAQVGQLNLVVTNPATVPEQSAPYVFNVVAVPTITGLTPVAAPIGSPDERLQVTGSGFLPDSVVTWNGLPLVTQYTEAPLTGAKLTATIPAAYLSLPTVSAVSVSSPENAGAVSQPTVFPTYLALPSNAITYNQRDGMLYASVPGSAGPGLGNSIVAINPTTGEITKTIPVGSEPDKLSISDDGTELFMSLDGAAAIKQIDLTGRTSSLQFSLGEYDAGQPYSYPLAAVSLAALPGQPDSVAVMQSTADVTVYDSGVARPNSAALDGYFNQNTGTLSFGSSASTLYASVFSDAFGPFVALTLNDTGFTGSATLSQQYDSFSTIQYDAGNLYLNNGIVLNAADDTVAGQFYSSGTNLAGGPTVSDSTLGRAWVLQQTTLPSNQILAFDEKSFQQVGVITVGGAGAGGPPYGTTDLVRWGQNGLAFNTGTQIYMVQSPLVKDVSQSPADLSVATQAPVTASTGGALTYSITVTNGGPNAAEGVTLSTTLADSIAYQNTTTSTGSCAGTNQVICNLGSLANGAIATVQVTGIALNPGSIESTALVSSTSYDPVQANNIATATTNTNGASYAPVPLLASVSPPLILAGSSATTLTVAGTGFTDLSTVTWNGTLLQTNYVSGTQLTAEVPSSYLSSLGWGQVAVSTPAPGGGSSASAVVSIYRSVNVPAAGLVYEPFTRKLYATVPATATNITGNSLVAIDPLTGTTGAPIALGNNPSVLAETGDGSELYIGFSGNNTLGQFNLASHTITGTYPLSDPVEGSQPANSLAVQPGSDNTLAISFSDGLAGIFDISGNAGAFRSNYGGAGTSLLFGDATHFYSETSNTADQYLARFTVDSNGFTPIDVTGLNGLGGAGFSLALGQDGLIYGDNGGIVNPETTPPSQIAVLPLTSAGAVLALSGDTILPDSTQHKAFVVGVNFAGAFTAYLQRFDTTNYINEESYQLPIPAGLSDQGYQLLRWGQDGLAVRGSDPYSENLAAYQLLLFKGPFVLPAEAQINPAPMLSAVAPATVTHGAANQYLTATGSGFMSGAVILWNGVAHTTNYIDAGHLQFAVAASDIATSQTVSLTAENPGSAASSSLPLVVQ